MLLANGAKALTLDPDDLPRLSVRLSMSVRLFFLIALWLGGIDGH